MEAKHLCLNNHKMIYPNLHEFREMIKERAYWKFKQRDFSSSHEWEDWFEAEREISNQCRYWLYD